eukprot:scaffold4338_cov183-Ochromonas_danica.AAC.8
MAVATIVMQETNLRWGLINQTIYCESLCVSENSRLLWLARSKKWPLITGGHPFDLANHNNRLFSDTHSDSQ